MHKISKPQETQLVSMSDDELINVLQNSIYPGAKIESIKLVRSYCAAAGLDPMQKPVHIVPMNVKDAQTQKYGWRDVIMPGVGLYRIQADRSKTMAGMSAPMFGDMVTEKFNDKNNKEVEVTYPEWCEVTVTKLVGDHLVTFTAREYWLENYATDSGKSSAPNAMWKKRARGQLAKCAEAQALRKGWPEIGQAPTAEEMQGKQEIDITDRTEIVVTEQVRLDPAVLPDYSDNDLLANLSKWKTTFAEGKSSPDHTIAMLESKFTLNDQQKEAIKGEYNANN